MDGVGPIGEGGGARGAGVKRGHALVTMTNGSGKDLLYLLTDEA